MTFKWFTSKTVRNASDMCKHVRKLLGAQRDILSQQAVIAIESSMRELGTAIQNNATEDQLKNRMTDLENTANKWLKAYPNASIRENVEVLLVALAVAMAIRTFFVQPFKIPTGSMQPTLFGVMPSPSLSPGSLPPSNDLALNIPGPVARFFNFWIRGESYFDETAKTDGELQRIKPPQKFLLFNFRQQYQFNGNWYSIWFPADDLFQRAGYRINNYDGNVVDAPHIKAGDPIVRLKVLAGDHLFVDRMSYNFRHPTRGEIIVFETRGISPMLPPDQFYIKRLVALGDEKVQIGDDRHLVINGVRLDKNTPHFENVYSFDPAQPPRESQYSGHLNQFVANEYHLFYNIAPLFPDQATVFPVRPDHYMVMGDNTCNSSDSRVWGDFPRTNVIGKYFFVYWPFSSRWGWNVK